MSKRSRARKADKAYAGNQPLLGKQITDISNRFGRSGISERALAPPFNPPHPLALFNPADPYSPTGLIGSLGNPINNKPAIKERMDKELSDLIFKEDKKVVTPPFDFSRYVRGFEKQYEDDSDYQELDGLLDASYSFSSIPRTNGVLGSFVVPPSKISMNALYNSTIDPIIGGSVNLIRANIISQFRQYKHSNSKADYVINMTLDALGRDDFFFRSTDFIIAGNAVGQLKWDTLKQGYHYYSRCTWAPYTDIQYQIDYYGNVIGALQPSITAPILGMFPGIDDDCAESLFAQRHIIPKILPYILVPREDLFYIAFDANSNPYGNSPIRRAYKYYLLKQVVMDMYTTALSRNGAPTVVAYWDKNMIANSSEIQDMYNQLASLTVGGTCALPSQKGKGFEIDMLPVNMGGLGAFTDALNYIDKMIKASLFPNDTMLMEANASYSSGTVNKTSFQEMYSLFVNKIHQEFINQIIKPIFAVNFPELLEKRDYGRFVSDVISDSQVTEILQHFELGVNSQLFDNTNLEVVNHYMDRLGMPLYKSEKDLPAVKNPNHIGKERMTNTRDTTSKPYNHAGGKPHEKGDYDAKP